MCLMWSVCSVAACSWPCTVRWVTSFLVRKSTENDSQNRDYKLGQQEETYSILTAHGYFGCLTFQDPRLTILIAEPAVDAQPTKRL